MTGVTYKGTRGENDAPHVTKQTDDLPPEPINPRLDLARHADGVNWGYFGSGCRQLAVALLADVLGDDDATTLSQRFKADVVCRLPWEGFEITAEAVERLFDKEET